MPHRIHAFVTPRRPLPGLATIALLVFAIGAHTQTAPNAEPDNEFFEKRVRPILVESCVACHGAARQMGNFRLDSRAAVIKGGDRGGDVTTSHPEKSLLIDAIDYATPGLQMPPSGKLSNEKIETLREWIRRGAPWPASPAPIATSPTGIKPFNLKERAKHWSFQPIVRAAVPKVHDPTWPRTTVDRFTLARLEAAHLKPAPAADRRTLLRRVTFDLTGLPPTSEEIRSFLNDRSPRAYEKVVDRLLASPHYGERWARHWLDLVRYAETDGHEFDFEKPGAYQYRDYVIRAFNSDLPYNRFVTEQIAGDLLPTPRWNAALGLNESRLATGFWWLGEAKHSPVDIKTDQSERLDNQIDVFGKAFLGLTVGCARCHDHKFDAISTKDYYALSGYLISTRYDVTPAERLDPASLESLRGLDRSVRTLLPTASVRKLRPQWDAFVSRLTQRLGAGQRLSATEPESTAERAVIDGAVKTAGRDALDPLAPIVALAGESAVSFPDRLKRLASRPPLPDTSKSLLWSFRDRLPDGWVADGPAFAVETDAPWITGSGTGEALRGITPGNLAVADAVSNRLTGTLRSPTFTISTPAIWYHVSGHGVRVRLVVDGFQLIRDPIYGTLEFEVNSDQLAWRAMDLSKWQGHRAYVEMIDSGGGRLAIDQIRSERGDDHDRNGLLDHLLKDAAITDWPSLVDRFRLLIDGCLNDWASGRLTTLPDRRERAELVDWAIRTIAPQGVPLHDPNGDPEFANALALKDAAVARLKPAEFAMAAADGTGENDRVKVRGDYRNLGPEVPRRFLEAICGPNQLAPKEGCGRLELAERMTSARCPLLARVMVNRIWQHHFGEGLVRTPDDFGIRGARPTHPKLLDWLASEFIRSGWSIKHMQRLMVLSSTYRMASVGNAEAERADPRNLLVHRAPIRRLEAEAIRDSILTVSGRLDPRVYGPSVTPYLTSFMEGRGRPEESGPIDGAGRRSIYISVRRNFMTPMFMAFDYPVPFNCMGLRSVSNVPSQALILMNDPFVVGQANLWARRLLAAPGTTITRIGIAYDQAFARPPTKRELASAAAFLTGHENDRSAWADYCHVLINTKEFIFVQ